MKKKPRRGVPTLPGRFNKVLAQFCHGAASLSDYVGSGNRLSWYLPDGEGKVLLEVEVRFPKRVDK